jgi:hypothetical protein
VPSASLPTRIRRSAEEREIAKAQHTPVDSQRLSQVSNFTRQTHGTLQSFFPAWLSVPGGSFTIKRGSQTALRSAGSSCCRMNETLKHHTSNRAPCRSAEPMQQSLMLDRHRTCFSRIVAAMLIPMFCFICVTSSFCPDCLSQDLRSTPQPAAQSMNYHHDRQDCDRMVAPAAGFNSLP